MTPAEVREHFGQWKAKCGDEITGMDFQIWSDLEPDGSQDGNSLTQLVSAAHRNDPGAVARFLQTLVALCREAEIIGEKHPQPVREAAKTMKDFPVRLTRSKRDQRRVIEYVEGLPLGENAGFVTTLPHKVDRSSLWTRYAESTITTYRINMVYVPIIQKWAELEARKFRTLAGRKVSSDGEPVLVLEAWMLKCKPGGERSAAKVWEAIKPAIRRYWTQNPKEYSEALSAFEKNRDGTGKPLTEGRKREQALFRIRQALFSLLSQSAPVP